MKKTDMLSTKIDLLMKRLEEWAQDKDAMMGTVQAMDSHMTCEVCGNIGHSGNDCPETSTTGFANQVLMGGTTSPARKVI